MKITCLVENTTQTPQLDAEHGLSLLIETQGKTILFDMGQSDLYAQNAQKLGIDLKAVDLAVLSHGHYDHGGGLNQFLQTNEKAPVYLTPTAFEPHFNGEGKKIGVAPVAQSHRLITTDPVHPIGENMWLYHCNDRPRTGEGTANFRAIKNGISVPDTFDHEQYLLLEEKGKRILISGCSHKGIENIMEWFSPHVLVGGFHFSKLPMDEALRNRAKTLASYETEYYTCHCTGTEQYRFMRPVIPKLHYLSTGQTVDV
ncbi:MAG: MBL fold metallo-hydrolase [Ruminococcaceae bacterium]|nr:MBL fold metallo-hydrolase [Oscillospiraceae bacterium]